jgi:hypothetical protein
MANPKQTWAKAPESGGADAQGHQATPGDSRPYADTNRFGKTQTGDTKPIQKPQNLVSDPVWGIQAPVGGVPADPEIRVTKGE